MKVRSVLRLPPYALVLLLVGASGCVAETIDEDIDEVEDELVEAHDLAAESASFSRHNQHRHQHVDAPALDRRSCLNAVARGWAKQLAQTGELEHNPNLAQQISNKCPWDWAMAAENIGVGGSEQSIFQAWLGSAGHHQNLDRARFRRVGIGAYWDEDDRLWMVVNFADPL